jgi:hypothetical protein
LDITYLTGLRNHDTLPEVAGRGNERQANVAGVLSTSANSEPTPL